MFKNKRGKNFKSYKYPININLYYFHVNELCILMSPSDNNALLHSSLYQWICELFITKYVMMCIDWKLSTTDLDLVYSRDASTARIHRCRAQRQYTILLRDGVLMVNGSLCIRAGLATHYLPHLSITTLQLVFTLEGERRQYTILIRDQFLMVNGIVCIRDRLVTHVHFA